MTEKYLHLVLKLVNFLRLAWGPSVERVAITRFTLSWWVSEPKETDYNVSVSMKLVSKGYE